MLFGDPADFAIEADVEPDLTPPFHVWGHMCVWCRGIPLGDLAERHCGLHHAYSEFRLLPALLDELWAPELAGLDNLATWNLLDGLLYGYHGDVEVTVDRSVEECRADWSVWGKFDFLTNWDEPFDGFKSFILCPPGGPVRILSRRLPAGMGLGVEVSRGSVIGASAGFACWFEEQQRRLHVGDASR